MGRKLNTFVHIDGRAYGPDDEVPAEVAEQITAPGVWADSGDATSGDVGPVDPDQGNSPAVTPPGPEDAAPPAPVDSKPKPADKPTSRRSGSSS